MSTPAAEAKHHFRYLVIKAEVLVMGCSIIHIYADC
jgi:hypothetical protein